MAWPTAPTQPVTALQPHSRPRRRLATGQPRLSVVVVNYRQWDRTADLVRQLMASACVRRGDAEVVIVDNHSPTHPAARRLRRLPGVSVRRWHANHGFARAVNEGCRLSQGEWFLLLNPDTTLSEGFLDGVLRLADEVAIAEPRAGIVGFRLRNGDGSQQLSAGPFPTLGSTLGRLLLPRSRRKYHAPRAADRSRVPWVTGCCMLIRRACAQDLGGLDESFFLYYEDVDLCLRARQSDWSVWYEPNLAVVHHNPLHCRTVPAVLRMVTRHSLLNYAAKHWPRWQFRLLARIVHTEALARQLWAWWEGDTLQSRIFGDMRVLAAELSRGEHSAAKARINRAVRAIDVRVGV